MNIVALYEHSMNRTDIIRFWAKAECDAPQRPENSKPAKYTVMKLAASTIKDHGRNQRLLIASGKCFLPYLKQVYTMTASRRNHAAFTPS